MVTVSNDTLSPGQGLPGAFSSMSDTSASNAVKRKPLLRARGVDCLLNNSFSFLLEVLLFAPAPAPSPSPTGVVD